MITHAEWAFRLFIICTHATLSAYERATLEDATVTAYWCVPRVAKVVCCAQLFRLDNDNKNE